MLPTIQSFRLRRKTRRFFSRHQELLIILGSLIIVATFVVKDVFRDRMKDVADSIDTAEDAYLIREATIDLHSEIDEVDANVVQVRTEVLSALSSIPKAKQNAYESDLVFKRYSQRLLRMENETGLEVDNLARLILKVPPTSERIAQFNDLYRQWDSLKMKGLKEGSIDINAKLFNPEAVNAQNVRDYADAWLISQKMHLTAGLILDDAQRVKEKQEYLIRVFTPISYALFVFGAMLTLLSQLFSPDGVPEAE
jgi:hypothetical protein